MKIKPTQMAWNDPGSGKDPWNSGGNRGNNGQQIPPEMEEMLNKFKDKLGSIFGSNNGGNSRGKSEGSGGNGGNGGIFGSVGLVLIALIAWVLSGIYIVDPGERGVVLRFGKYQETTTSGPHWHLPSPIETVTVLNVNQIRNLELGFRSGSRNRGTGSVRNESLMLTEDTNIVSAKFAIQYRIKDARDYLFNVHEPEGSLYQISQSAIRNVIGTSKMDFVLKEGRAEIAAKVEKIIQEVADTYKTGLEIMSVNMQDAQPPDEVQAAFEDAVKATEDKQRFVNKAEAYSNEVIPKARGESARILAEANAYKEQIEAKAKGEASRFSQILTEYQKAPEITRERLYLETMEQVLGNTGKVILDSSNNNSLMMLPLDKLLSDKSALPRQTEMLKQKIRNEIETMPARTVNRERGAR